MIILQRANVVRRVASDEAARKLEEQGVARTGGIAEVDNTAVGINIDLDALADKLAERLKAVSYTHLRLHLYGGVARLL